MQPVTNKFVAMSRLGKHISQFFETREEAEKYAIEEVKNEEDEFLVLEVVSVAVKVVRTTVELKTLDY